MSATVFVEFARRVEIREWAAFCHDHSLEFSPSRIGYNGYYSADLVVEINLNRQGAGPTCYTSRGLPDFRTSAPPAWFTALTVATVYTEKPENMELVASIAVAIVGAFRGSHEARIVEADERLERYLGVVGWV